MEGSTNHQEYQQITRSKLNLEEFKRSISRFELAVRKVEIIEERLLNLKEQLTQVTKQYECKPRVYGLQAAPYLFEKKVEELAKQYKL